MLGKKTLGTIVAAMLAAACGGAEPAAPVSPTAAIPPPMPTTPATTEKPVTAPTAAAKPAATPEETTKSLVAAWNAHDADKVAAAYAESGVLHIFGVPELDGRAAIKAAAASAFKTFPDFKVALTRVTMKGNVAAIEWVITGTQTGDDEAMKLKASGRKMGVHGAGVVTFDDAGLVKEEHRYFDIPTEMAQLDAKAKAGTFRPVETLPTGAPAVLVSKGTPEEQKNLDAIDVMYKAFDQREADGVVAVMTADGTMDDWTNPTTFKGPKGAKAFLETLFKAIPDVTQDKNVQIAAGDLVVTEGYMHGTMKGNMGPLKATNKPIGLHFVDVMQIKDGKMVKGWTYANSMEMMPPHAK